MPTTPPTLPRYIALAGPTAAGKTAAALGIAQDRSIVCGISFGLADPAHPANGFRTQRAAPGDSVTWRD